MIWTSALIFAEFHPSWHPVVNVYMNHIKLALQQSGIVYPLPEHIFRVFKMPMEDIKVVILAQDPYHGEGQARGLAFDCEFNNGRIQPSLLNMFKELKAEFPERKYKFEGGGLSRWADEEDIFLLNSALTVRRGEPGSLLEYWYDFTDAIIQYIADYNPDCVFLLMGSPAKAKGRFIKNKNRIVDCAHPSPMSAHRGFFKSNVFKRIEELVGEINWSNVRTS